jgi:uncharacterized protein (TIGR02246 family)
VKRTLRAVPRWSKSWQEGQVGDTTRGLPPPRCLFHPDAVWTTAHGKVLIGLDAISEFTRKVLPAANWDGKVSYEVVHVLFIRPDVAAVKVRQRYLSPDDKSEGAPLYVMTKQDDGRWLLTACQNTGVVAD